MNFASLSQFLNEFATLESEVNRKLYAQEMKSLSLFLPKVGEFKEPLLTAHKNETPDYNLFSIMKIRHYEAWVHTPFLVNLLDPNGSHAQGDVFYRSFINEAFDWQDPLKEIFLEGRVRKIAGEFNVGKLGIIDIWIEIRHKGKDYCLIIENKVYAKDQYKQLLRYYVYARRKGYCDSAMRIFYLTAWNGGRPSSQSLKPSIREKLIESKTLQFISYHQSIAGFLRRSLHDLVAPRLTHSIQQYLEVISKL